MGTSYKMKFLLLFLLPFIPNVVGKCRNIKCYFRSSGDYNSGIIVDTWNYRTCDFSMSCSRATGRVPSRCQRDLSTQDLNKMCKKIPNVPSIFSPPHIKMTDIYLHGKADCASNDKNNWMVPEKKGRLCCSKMNNQYIADLC